MFSIILWMVFVVLFIVSICVAGRRTRPFVCSIYQPRSQFFYFKWMVAYCLVKFGKRKAKPIDLQQIERPQIMPNLPHVSEPNISFRIANELTWNVFVASVDGRCCLFQYIHSQWQAIGGVCNGNAQQRVVQHICNAAGARVQWADIGFATISRHVSVSHRWGTEESRKLHC